MSIFAFAKQWKQSKIFDNGLIIQKLPIFSCDVESHWQKKNYWQSETLVIVNLENVHPFSWLFFVGWLFFFIMHIILYCNILSLRLSGATVSSYWKLWTGLDRNSSWVDLGSSDWWPLFLLTGWEWTRVWCCVHSALGAWDTVICSWMSVIINLNHETHCTS